MSPLIIAAAAAAAYEDCLRACLACRLPEAQRERNATALLLYCMLSPYVRYSSGLLFFTFRISYILRKHNTEDLKTLEYFN